MNNNFKILNLEAKKGEKKQGFINVTDTSMSMPVTIINGEYEGKTILITSGIHGCEYPCIQTAVELSKEINPQDVHGQIILVHPVNAQAFINRSAAIVPEDGKNINRVFPGDKEGTIADKIAYTLTHDFQDIADFYLDLHGGDLHEDLTPYVYYPGACDKEISEKSKCIAEVLDVEYMVKSSATTGAYNSAAIRGIPSILIERGGCGICKREDVDSYKCDVLNILKYLNIIDNKSAENRNKPKEIQEVIYLDSKSDGLWTSYVTAGQKVKKGDKLGEITDYFGNIIDTYYSQLNGVILYHTVALSVTKDSSLVAYGRV